MAQVEKQVFTDNCFTCRVGDYASFGSAMYYLSWICLYTTKFTIGGYPWYNGICVFNNSDSTLYCLLKSVADKECPFGILLDYIQDTSREHWNLYYGGDCGLIKEDKWRDFKSRLDHYIQKFGAGSIEC